MNGLTTIAAIPRTGGAGMALRGETNTRPIRYDDLDEAHDLALLRGLTPERNFQEWSRGDNLDCDVLGRPEHATFVRGIDCWISKRPGCPDVVYREGMSCS